jgi:hypothetical protein
MNATAYAAQCYVNVSVPVELEFDANTYGKKVGRVYSLRLTISEGRVRSIEGRIHKFKKDGSPGESSAQISWGDVKWADLPDVIRKEVAAAYAEWAAAIPRKMEP